MKCPKCRKEKISTTNDGIYGVRDHCLYCGNVWKHSNVAEESVETTKETQKKETE